MLRMFFSTVMLFISLCSIVQAATVNITLNEVSSGTWELRSEVLPFAGDTLGLAGYALDVVGTTNNEVSYVANTLTVLNQSYEGVGFVSSPLAGKVGNFFSIGHSQASTNNGETEIFGIGIKPISIPNLNPNAGPVDLDTSALLGTFTTPDGLTSANFARVNVALFPAGYRGLNNGSTVNAADLGDIFLTVNALGGSLMDPIKINDLGYAAQLQPEPPPLVPLPPVIPLPEPPVTVVPPVVEPPVVVQPPRVDPPVYFEPKPWPPEEVVLEEPVPVFLEEGIHALPMKPLAPEGQPLIDTTDLGEAGAPIDWWTNTDFFIDTTNESDWVDDSAINLPKRVFLGPNVVTGLYPEGWAEDGGLSPAMNAVYDDNSFFADDFDIAPASDLSPSVPEPSTLLLAGLGLIGMMGLARSRPN